MALLFFHQILNTFWVFNSYIFPKTASKMRNFSGPGNDVKISGTLKFFVHPNIDHYWNYIGKFKITQDVSFFSKLNVKLFK